MDRRRFIHAVSLGSLTAIAGCGGNEVEDSDNGGTYNTTTSVIKGTDARTERTTHNKPVSESWTKELKRRIGQGHHFPRPTVNNGTLFISAGLNEEGTIYALDSDTGDTQWSYRVRASVLGYRVLPIIDKNLFVPQSGKLLAINIKKEELEWRTDAGVNTEIITDGKNLYFGTFEGVQARKANTGEILWESSPSGLVSPPTIHSGDVYVVMDNTAFRLNGNNGEVIWQTPVGSPSEVPPEAHGDTVYFGTKDGKIYAFNISDGSKRWDVAFPNSIVFKPVSDSERIYSTGWSYPYYALDTVTGKEQWKFDPRHPPSCTATVEDDRFYTGSGSGKIYSVDVKSGKPLWSFQIGSGGMWASITLDDGSIYAASGDGTVRHLKV